MSTGGKFQNQNRTPQEPTITEKSSGLNYYSNEIAPKDEAVGERKKVTEND